MSESQTGSRAWHCRGPLGARLCLLPAIFVCCLLLFALSGSVALAHVPQLVEGGAALGAATIVSDPAVSQVHYGEIAQPGEIRYYQMEFAEGERIQLQVITPERDGFAPGLALVGPGLDPAGVPPDNLEIPEGGTAVVIDGKQGEAEYEPFTPGAYRYPAALDVAAPETGTYFAAVFSVDAAGAHGLVIGYEERYNLTEWVRLPADLLNIYAWDGGWPLALLPGVVAVAAGAALLAWRQVRSRKKRGLAGWLAVAAGLLYLSTSAIVTTQAVRALSFSGPDSGVVVTVVFIAAPLLLGGLLIRLGWSDRMSPPAAANTVVAAVPGWRTRLAFFLLGLGGLALLAGYLLGPALALAAAVVPPYRRR